MKIYGRLTSNILVIQHASLRCRQRVVGLKMNNRQAERALREMYRESELIGKESLLEFRKTHWPLRSVHSKEFVLVVKDNPFIEGSVVIITVLTPEMVKEQTLEMMEGKRDNDETIIKLIDPNGY